MEQWRKSEIQNGITKTEALQKIAEIALDAGLNVEVSSIGNYDDKPIPVIERLDATDIDWITISK